MCFNGKSCKCPFQPIVFSFHQVKLLRNRSEAVLHCMDVCCIPAWLILMHNIATPVISPSSSTLRFVTRDFLSRLPITDHQLRLQQFIQANNENRSLPH